MAALAALDALPVSHMGHVHLARTGTQAAAVALARIHPEGQQGHPAEEGVDSPQRAQEAAEAFLQQRKGNCYCFAATFMYCARRLGYQAMSSQGMNRARTTTVPGR